VWLAVSAVILATYHKILKRSGDSVEDDGIETMALTGDVEVEQEWSLSDAPGRKVSKIKGAVSKMRKTGAVSKMRKKGARFGIV
jgi:hypothetical protein